MKITLLTLVALIFISPSVLGQQCRDYACVISKVERLMKQPQKDYKAILDNLDSAEGYPDSKAEQIRTLRRRVFDLIENEKNEAKRARQDADEQKKISEIQTVTAKLEKKRADQKTDETKQALLLSDSLFNEAEKQRQIAIKKTVETELALVKLDSLFNIEKEQQEKVRTVLNRIYFFDNQFGLAFDSSSQKYGFIDKNLKVKISFNYSEALPFNKLGFSRAKKLDSIFLIDTSGLEFPLKTSLYSINLTFGFVQLFFSRTRKNKIFKALDLSNEGRFYYPIYIEKYLKQNIEILYLDNNKLKKIPNRITKMKNLKYISTSDNRIINMGSKLTSINGLLKLALNNNKISKIPNDIGKLKNLEFLNLSFNQIEEIPNSIGDLKYLRHLDLRHNHVYKMPLEIAKLKSLKHLDLRENSIPKEEQEKIKKLVPNCKIEF